MASASSGAVASAAAFAACSVAMTLFNKTVLSAWGFDAPLTLTALQAAASALLLACWAAAQRAKWGPLYQTNERVDGSFEQRVQASHQRSARH